MAAQAQTRVPGTRGGHLCRADERDDAAFFPEILKRRATSDNEVGGRRQPAATSQNPMSDVVGGLWLSKTKPEEPTEPWAKQIVSAGWSPRSAVFVAMRGRPCRE
ncbi:hypothetical protein, partial [Rhodosalinus sediminis]|uniref:hypothetical protein n=1 Tax=Rhodosalinus sediminis TaxID=1940533 RepID=UPI001960F94F